MVLILAKTRLAARHAEILNKNYVCTGYLSHAEILNANLLLAGELLIRFKNMQSIEREINIEYKAE